jgi:nickel/cobalt transporter (NicO) family protein
MDINLIVGLLSLAGLHALLPTHWVSFVVVARAQGWPARRMITTVLMAGSGHLLSTIAVGLIASALGKATHAIETPIPAVILLTFGLYYVVVGWRRGGHKHCCHSHDDDPVRTDKWAAWMLFLEMTTSPCETMIPIFFASAGMPWGKLLFLALLVSGLTMLTMLVLSYLAFTGYKKLTFPWLERNQQLVSGGLLMGLGGFAYFVR